MPTSTDDRSSNTLEDPFVIAVREYILATLNPLIPTGDQTGRFMANLLRRALKSATRSDLEQVVLHCVAFTDGLREQGFITEELAREAHEYVSSEYTLPLTEAERLAQEGDTDTDTDDDTDPTDWAAVPGPGALDRPDEEWQVNPSQVFDPGLPTNYAGRDEVGMATTTDTGAGHEASMAGDQHDQGSVSGEALQEDGTR